MLGHDAADDAAPNRDDAPMSELIARLPKHPIGTFAFVGAYAVVFVCLWFATYTFIYLARQPVTP